MICNKQEYINKFKFVTHNMFPNTNQDFTFNNFDKYINNPELDELGIYVIKVKNKHDIKIVQNINEPEGPTEYKGKPLKGFRNYRTIEGFKNKLNQSDNEILYIGATPYGNTLNKRLSLYRDFGIAKGNTKVSHSGGKRIWFIENNKNNLVIDYININTLQNDFTEIYNFAETLKKNFPNIKSNIVGLIEAGLLYLHSLAYESKYPFANEEFECIDTENAWLCFWTNYKIN